MHKQAVRCTRFSSDLQHIITGSDDKTIRSLNLPTESEAFRLEGHSDHIRSVVESPASLSTWISGSYDHTVKVWDTRAKSCAMTLDHGDPVESVLAMPQGSLVVSAGNNTMKVWDLLAGGRLVCELSNHQKTITSLAMDKEGTRVLSGSLDCSVKVYETEQWSVSHSFKLNEEVSSVAVSHNKEAYAIGYVSGKVVIKRRGESEGMKRAKAQAFAKLRKPHTGTRKFFMRGGNYLPDESDFVVDHRAKRPKLKAYDRDLKKFQYHKALDDALSTKQAPIIVSVIEELIYRNALRIALAGRDQDTLEPVLSFVHKQLDNPTYASLLIDIVNIVLDMYSCVIGQSVTVDELFMKLKRKVTDEIDLQKSATSLLGSIDLVLASAVPPSDTTDAGSLQDAIAALAKEDEAADEGTLATT